MLTSPPEIFAAIDGLKNRKDPFVIATVIAVRGAASAKTGAKALFNAEGKNILGWVGGGCAESFLGRQSMEVLEQKSPLVVTVNLDDEIFGLLPCGGVMDVYLEPHFPAAKLRIPNFGTWQEPVKQFIAQLGFDVDVHSEKFASPKDWSDAFLNVAKILSENLDKPLRPLRETKGHGTGTLLKLHSAPLTIIGRSRISEELCRMAKLLDWEPNVVSAAEFPALSLPEKSYLIVASHNPSDHLFITRALKEGAAYVALVASEKRTKLTVHELQSRGVADHQMGNFFAPAGLSVPADTPTQIAFSILCEILFLQSGTF